MKLNIYRQRDNLIWFKNQWRFANEKKWKHEVGSGSFSLYNNDQLYMIEAEEAPATGTTGSLYAFFSRGKLYLTYLGAGERTNAFSTILDKDACSRID